MHKQPNLFMSSQKADHVTEYFNPLLFYDEFFLYFYESNI